MLWTMDGAVTDQPVLPQPYGGHRGHTRRGWLAPRLGVRLGVWKVSMFCPLWEERDGPREGQGSS